ncbi:patatin-like phospholipase family protein [Modestobacter roseus]|uniref:NTE family protein n=1 Tax=Modestobacter roseus TaxID=1181884 RepID=A0A562IM88_9ACTN|nr:patatin-like phospholipase family protein [Modestobacter roseus]TWH71813.1 NTE family protein [Modestobacter roseus]
MSEQRRALVLGGGGVTGIAWTTGVLTGLADAGLDLTDADLVVGTSAGSIVGTQLRSGVPVAELFDTEIAPPAPGPTARLGRRTLARYGLAMLMARRDDAAFRRRVGALALAAADAGATPSEEDWRQLIAVRLPGPDWPEQPLVLTAVDAQSGEFRTFDRDSGVDLLAAVAASCAVPGVYPPVTVDGRRYIDGGMRSVANADLATGCDRVVVIAPIVRGVGPMAGVDAQVTGMVSRVAVVAPDQGSRTAIGKNVLDPAARPASARAGRAQAAAVAAEVAEAWQG